MSQSILALGSSTDSTYGHDHPPKPRDDAPEAPVAETHSFEPADTRLVIEDDPVEGATIYLTVDGRTGAILRKMAGDEVLRLREAKTYVAGQLVKARA